MKNETEQLKENRSKGIIKKQVKILSGFFPFFIYIPVKKNSQTQLIQKSIQQYLKQKQIKFQTINYHHITLTKTINILQGQVQQFHNKIQKRLKGRVILPIILLFKKIILLQNFICLQVQKISHQRLKKITQIIGQVIQKPYFQNPVYHISLFKLFQKIDSQVVQQLIKTCQMKLKSKTAILLSQIFVNAGIKKIKLKI